MYGIDVLVKEHDNVLRFNKVLRSVCLMILEGGDVPAEDFRGMIDFIKGYIDKHHHGKEELFLFSKMQKRLGKQAEHLIKYGMLVEHDLARLQVQEMDTALKNYQQDPSADSKLDLIAGAIGYTRLLERHIDKENNAIYPFGERSLDKEDLSEIDQSTHLFEENAEHSGSAKKYLEMLKNWENKYLS